jgi:hypothetical protein
MRVGWRLLTSVVKPAGAGGIDGLLGYNPPASGFICCHDWHISRWLLGVPALIHRMFFNSVDKLLKHFLLASGNGRDARIHAVSRPGLLATMKAQQAVAIRFVGRRVTTFDVPFFCLRHGPVRAFTSLRDMSLQRNGLAVVASASALPKCL